MYHKLFELQENVFKVIANQKRLEIIQLLDGRELSVTQMIAMLGLPQANLSQHLAHLRQSKIVTTRRVGQTVFYKLSDPKIHKACLLIKEFLADTHQLSPDTDTIQLDGEQVYPIVKDIVCGMRFSVSNAGGIEMHNGRRYYFCATGCAQEFTKNTNKYTTKEVVHG